MSRRSTIALLLAALAAAALPAAEPAAPLLDAQGRPAGFHTLAIGDPAPDFSLPGIDGRTHSLSEFAEFDVLMVIFTSNHCPTSHGMERRLQQLRTDLRGRSFGVVAINPNHPDGLRVDELGYGEFTDSFADMKPYAQKNGWDFPYLYDGDQQLTARAFGCLATPHVFLFDRERRLRYAGRFDDSRFPDPATVTSPDARRAAEAMLAGQPVPVALTRPHGCSTKWREKRALHAPVEEAWKKIPVLLERIDGAGLARLRANATGKYRLFNLWSTRCPPCVEEFPALVDIAHQFDQRDFELVTVNVDLPAEAEKAQAFLQKQGAGLTRTRQDSVEQEGRRTNHYRFDDENQDALFDAIDRDWGGVLPHTLLVAPGGRILWRCDGAIDPAAARTAIVAALTPYYGPPAPAK